MTSLNPIVEAIEALPQNVAYQALIRCLKAEEKAALMYLYEEEDPERILPRLMVWRALKKLITTLANTPADLLVEDYLDDLTESLEFNKETTTADAIGFPRQEEDE